MVVPSGVCAVLDALMPNTSSAALAGLREKLSTLACVPLTKDATPEY